MIDFEAEGKRMAALVESSPHRCAGGCGSKMLREGSWCSACDDRRRAEDERRQRDGATTHTIPTRYRWCRFDAPELVQRVRDAAAIERAKAAVDAERVAFLGAAGIGKTVLGTCLLRAMASKLGTSGRFTDAYVLNLARAHASLGEEAAPVENALHADVLLLDDLGAEKACAQSAIGDVLHARHAAMRRTIVTTGFSVDGIRAKYGDGVARRVFESATVIELSGVRVRAA